ncbi:MAG TPA: serine/threonine-protein kinase [Planctomycetota bacterium]|nr:serine/threonine-protein kinase [Planctomycetota bacterium]
MGGSLGDYVLEAEVGHGAMGRVYRATHRPTGSIRAVKVISTRLDPETVARFKREAEALARAGGEGVVPVHEVGAERGRLYLAMSFMPGGSLRDRIKRGPVPWRDAVKLTIELARALERCHAAGLVHRDLKPDNILFDDEGRPRIADFGLVRDLGSRSLTQQDQILGTPMYMAPELLGGERATAAADVYALGVILHELVTGRPPHLASSLSEITQLKAKGTRPRLGNESPPELDLILDRAVARKPQQRYPTATALRVELEAFLAGETRSRLPLVWIGVTGAVLLVALAVTLWATRPAAPPPPAPPPHVEHDQTRQPPRHDTADKTARDLVRVAGLLETGAEPASVAAEVSHALASHDPLPRAAVERILRQLRSLVDASRGTDADMPIIAALQAIRLAKRFEVEIPLDRPYGEHVLAWARHFRLATDGEWRLEAVDAFAIAAREKHDVHYLRDVVRGACALLRVHQEVADEARSLADEAFRGFAGSGLRTPLDLHVELLASMGRPDEALELLGRAVTIKGGETQDEELDDAAIALYRAGWPPRTPFRAALLDKAIDSAPAFVQGRILRAFCHAGKETDGDLAALEAATELDDPFIDLSGADPERKISTAVQAREREAARNQLANLVDRIPDARQRARILVRLGRTDEAARVCEQAGGDLGELAPRVRASADEKDRAPVIKLLGSP